MNIADLFYYNEARRCPENMHLAVTSLPVAVYFIVEQ